MKKLTWGAVIAALVAAGILGYNVLLSYCLRNPNDPACAAVLPSPTPLPTPTPTAIPTPTPTATPNPTPTPTASPTPSPSPSPTSSPTPQSACPFMLAVGAKWYLVDAYYGHGEDSTLRIWGDPKACAAVGGSGSDCHLGGLPQPRRFNCEYEIMHGCAEWQYNATPNGPALGICHNDQSALASCDHFGRAGGAQDDPRTRTTGDTLETLWGFEGEPRICGLQRDEFGPRAAPFTVAHGDAYVRACPPGAPLTEPSSGGPGKPTGRCGPWLAFDH